MLRLYFQFIAQGRKDFCKTSKRSDAGIYWKALPKCSQMRTHVPGFQLLFRFLHDFVLAKFPTSSIRVNNLSIIWKISAREMHVRGEFTSFLEMSCRLMLYFLNAAVPVHSFPISNY